MIATDPLSLLFIACFLCGLLFFIVTALLGNLGHGVAHGATHHAGLHIGHQSAGVHTAGAHAPTAPYTVSHAPAHTPGQAAGSHSTTHDSSQGQHQALLSLINPMPIMLFLLGFGFFGYFVHTTIHFVAAFPLILPELAGVAFERLLPIIVRRPVR